RPEKEWVNLNDLVEELMILLRDEARRRQVRLHAHLEADLPQVRVDRVQLQQVILNRMVNAMDAMNDSPAEERRVLVASRGTRHKGIVIRVEDCGQGLAPELCEKIFEPFFSTKPHGIGVGLSISRS